MRICGVKATHDGAVALIEDGRLVFAVESEKIANRPRYSRLEDLFEIESILHVFGLELRDVDALVFDGWHRRRKVRSWAGLDVELLLGPYRRGLRSDDVLQPYPGTVLDVDYLTFSHYAGHVAASYCTSPFAAAGEPAFILSWDGLMYPFLYHCDGDPQKITTLGPLFPLVGNAYQALAGACPPFDDLPSGHENLGIAGKIMAYQSLGVPHRHAMDHVLALVDSAHAAARAESLSGTDELFQLESGVARVEALKPQVNQPGLSAPDMIASVHAAIGERLVTSLVAAVADAPYDTHHLCLSGGTALNIKWNRAIRASGAFDAVWIPPFPNDSGAAVGAACCGMITLEGRAALTWDVYLGPGLGPVEVPDRWSSAPFSLAELAELLHRTGQPVVVLTGRAELGPRALGHRSILAPAVDPGMQAHLNAIKGREDYRPVAPICLEAEAPAIFDPGSPDPYMLFDHDVRPDWATRVPAVCHVDGTARLQTVSQAQCPEMFELLRAYHELSGVPLLCNTSANRHGCGFFPDAGSAMRWSGCRYVWSEGLLYTDSGP